MADKYCDHGLYAYAATPTWGVAQDGDGTAIGASTPATVSIDMASMTAAAGNTIAVGGAVLTCVASGATTNQFNAGSGATLVDNIVAAINRTTNTSAIAAAATGWVAQKIQDAVFARKTGTAVLEIMYRAGSATHNSNSLSQVALSGFTGGAGPYTFSGGAGGAWGWFVNDRAVGTLWPSTQAKWAYGASRGNTLAGTILLNEFVHLRANNAIIKANLAAATTFTIATLGHWLVDNGTIWTGDTGYFKFLHENNSGTYAFTIAFTRLIDQGATYFGSRDKSKLIFENNSTTGILNFIYIGLSTISRKKCVVDNFTCIDNSAPIVLGIIGNGSFTSAVFRRFTHTINRNAFYQQIVWHNTNGSQRVEVEDADFYFTFYTGAPVTLYGLASAYGPTAASMKNCRYYGAVIPSLLSVSMTLTNQYLTFENVSGVTISNLCNIFNNSMYTGDYLHGESTPYSRIVIQDIGPNKNFRIETPYYVLDWISDSGYPTLDAMLPNGVFWSYSLLIGTAMQTKLVYQILKLSKTNSVNTNTVVTLHLLLPASLVGLLKDNMLFLDITYQRASDGAGVVVSGDMASSAGNDFSASSAPWALGSYTSHVAKKLVVTLPSAMKSGTEVIAFLKIADNSPSGSAERLFINPELELS
jgi:hypothetical protein